MLDTNADVTEILTPAAREPEPTKALEPVPSAEQSFRTNWRVGMRVLYRRPDGPHAGEERPAVITRVNPSTCNLLVMLDGPNDSNTFDPKTSPTTEWRGSIYPSEDADAWNTFRRDESE